MIKFYLFPKVLFILAIASWSFPVLAQTVCNPLGPLEVQFVSEGSQGGDITASFTPTDIVLTGDEWVIPVRGDGNQVGCPVAVQEGTGAAAGTFFFQGIRVQRALDCDAPGLFTPTVRQDQAAFGIDCDAGVNRETALQLVDTDGNYEGFFFVIFDPERGGEFFVVTGAGGAPFDGTSTNALGGSTQLPPAAPGATPATDVSVPDMPLESREEAQAVINPALPVALTTFSGRPNGKNVLLEWTTETEAGNAAFEIQRRASNDDFLTIGQVAGAGDSRIPLNYSFTDLAAADGTNYYRLKQVDIGGDFIFSPIISVFMDGGAEDRVLLFPNPASGAVNLVMKGDWGTSTVSMIDVAGRTVREWSGLPANTRTSLSLENLVPGVYQVRIADEKKVITRRVVKR